MQTSPILMHEDTINFHGWEKKKVSYVVLVSTCDKTVFLFGLVIRLRQKYGTPCPNLALLSISDLDILGQESRNISDVPMFWVVSFQSDQQSQVRFLIHFCFWSIVMQAGMKKNIRPSQQFWWSSDSDLQIPKSSNCHMEVSWKSGYP